jgi:hypothetical protein
MKQIFNSKNRMFVVMLAITMVVVSMNFMPVAVATAEAMYQDYSRTVISVWGVVAKRVVGLDSLRAQGPALLNGTLTGTAAVRGTATFEAGATVDTVVQADITSSSYIFLTARLGAGGDSTGFGGLFYTVVTDTIFVRQKTSVVPPTLDYNYLIVN